MALKLAISASILTAVSVPMLAQAKVTAETVQIVPKVDERDLQIVRLHARLSLVTHRWKVRGKVIHRLQRRLRERELRAGAAPAHSRSLSYGVPSWFYRQALCIHGHEGAWNDQDSGHNGHYGGLQFAPSTWAGAGGHGNPADASPAEQIYRAWIVYRRDGNSWREWSTAGLCGL